MKKITNAMVLCAVSLALIAGCNVQVNDEDNASESSGEESNGNQEDAHTTDNHPVIGKWENGPEEYEFIAGGKGSYKQLSNESKMTWKFNDNKITMRVEVIAGNYEDKDGEWADGALRVKDSFGDLKTFDRK